MYVCLPLILLASELSRLLKLDGIRKLKHFFSKKNIEF